MSETGGAALLSPAGERVAISDEMYETFLSMLGGERPPEAAGSAERLLTTGEGAALLGVSSKTFSRIVDRGDIPCVRYGQRGRRRVREADVLAYRDASRQGMAQGVREAVRIAEDAGLYDIDFGGELAR